MRGDLKAIFVQIVTSQLFLRDNALCFFLCVILNKSMKFRLNMFPFRNWGINLWTFGIGVDEPACLWDSQTRMATMLRLEKSRRIKFSPGRWPTTDQKALKWMRAYAKGSGTVDGTDFRSFFRSWRLFLWRSSFSFINLLQNYVSNTAYIHRYV